MKKRITTIFLTLALVVSVGAFAAVSLSKTSISVTAETQSGAENEYTVSPTEFYTFTSESPDTHTPEAAAPGVAAWKDLLGMKKFVNSMTTADTYAYIGFDEVDVTNYAFVNFKAFFWAEGGAGKVGSYADTDIYTAGYVDTGYKASIFRSWSNDCNQYTVSSFYVSVPTSVIKENNKVSGFIVKNSAGCGWFMIGDITFSDYCYTRVDTDASGSVSGTDKYGITLQNNTDEDYTSLWKSEELLYRTSITAGSAFVTTVKFTIPIAATQVDYFRLKILGWEKSKYADVTLKNLDGTEIKTLKVCYGYDTSGDLNCYLPVDGLENENGMIEGFILDCPKATNLVFADALGYKGSVEPIISVSESLSGDNVLAKEEWTAIPPVGSEGLYYNGRRIGNGTMSIVFKLPIDSNVYKSIDFKALIWNNASLKDVEIRKLDGTLVETIKVKASYANENGDIGVKLNATLLADEKGMVAGFKMNALDNLENNGGHFVFSAPSGNTTEKTYTAKIVFANGSENAITYTAENRAAKLAEIKAKLGVDDAQYAYTDDLPAELPFAEGRTYTETKTIKEYDVVIGDAAAVKVAYGSKLAKPADPVKPSTESMVYAFDGWYNGETKWDFDNDIVTGNVTLVAKFSEKLKKFNDVKLKAIDVCLNGKIAMEFYYELPAEIVNDEGAYISFSVGSEDATKIYVKDVKESTDDQGRYKFVCGVAAAQMTLKIKATLYDGSGSADQTRAYSIKDYADYMLENGNEEQKEMVKAMLNYGAYAQIFFGIDAENLANSGLFEGNNPVDTVEVKDTTNIITGAATGFDLTTYELLLQSETVMQLYFTATDISALEITVDGENAEVVQDGERFAIIIRNIPAALLDDYIKVTVRNTSDNTVYTIETCATCCVSGVVKSQGTSTELVNLMKALYLYNAAANAYFA